MKNIKVLKDFEWAEQGINIIACVKGEERDVSDECAAYAIDRKLAKLTEAQLAADAEAQRQEELQVTAGNEISVAEARANAAEARAKEAEEHAARAESDAAKAEEERDQATARAEAAERALADLQAKADGTAPAGTGDKK